ncbi:MAG: DUF4142 domain-containing protein [Phycisphaerales bacterium]
MNTRRLLALCCSSLLLAACAAENDPHARTNSQERVITSTSPDGKSYTSQPSSEPSDLNSTLYPRTDAGQHSTVRTPEPPPYGQKTTVVNPNQPMWPEVRILSYLHAVNQEEIDIGRLAADKGGTEMVKEYGRSLARDHTASDEKVIAMAKSLGLTLVEPDQIMPMINREKGDTSTPKDPVEQLSALGGSRFDHEFAEKMQSGHREAIRTVEAALPLISNLRVRDLLNETLPSLRHHEEMATQLLNSLPPTTRP